MIDPENAAVNTFVLHLCISGGLWSWRYLDKGSNDTKTCQPEVLKGSRLAGGVEEGVEEEWHMCCREMRQNQIMMTCDGRQNLPHECQGAKM